MSAAALKAMHLKVVAEDEPSAAAPVVSDGPDLPSAPQNVVRRDAAALPAAPNGATSNVPQPSRLKDIGTAVFHHGLPPVVGFGAVIVLWLIVNTFTPEFPTPKAALEALIKVFAHPFYKAGPNDVGIGFKILNSLGRVAMGFGLAAIVGIPLGFLTGRSQFFGRMLNPVITLLRPVSPLAWLPIGLLVFKGANPAAIWTIFICSIWPMIINTAVGVQRVPQDYLNVAKVLNLSEWKITTKILLPSVLPYILTGVRLAVGTAWLVIVAAEMLTGGVGIGFWVWDEWNNLNVANIVVAILIIGMVGLILEMALIQVAKAFTYEDVKQ